MLRRNIVSLRFAACATVAVLSIFLSAGSSQAQRMKYVLALPGTSTR
jgi:hypothetical protein